MALTRFTPFRAGLNDVTVLQNRLNSIFNDFAKPAADLQSESLVAGNFVPAVDVYEDAQKLVLKLEVPGIPKDALDIRVEGRTLTVKGERKFENEEKEENFYRIERRYGSFIRSFTLPNTVDVDHVDAQAVDGVLSISFAKKPEAKPKQIEVKAGPAAEAAKQVEAGAVAA
jgi:HSP20 family protein